MDLSVIEVIRRSRGTHLGMVKTELGTRVEAELASLSSRERAVLDLAIQGFKDKAISEELGIAKGTVGTYWNRIRRKLGPKTRAEIAAIVGRSEARETNSELVDALEQLRETREQLEAEMNRRRAAERYLKVLRCLAVAVARYNTFGKRSELILGKPENFDELEEQRTTFAQEALAAEREGEPRSFAGYRLIPLAAGDILVALFS